MSRTHFYPLFFILFIFLFSLTFFFLVQLPHSTFAILFYFAPKPPYQKHTFVNNKSPSPPKYFNFFLSTFPKTCKTITTFSPCFLRSLHSTATTLSRDRNHTLHPKLSTNYTYYTMFSLIHTPASRLLIKPTAVLFSRTFFGWFTKYNKKLIYPPPPSQISTRNRLFPTYIESPTELGTLVLTKDPLLLNFTFPGDPECNKVTQSLFDILSNSKQYPLDSSKPVELANIACDSVGGRELQHTYAVGKIPSIVLLKKQMVADRFIPTSTDRVGEELKLWIKTIY